MASYSSIKPAVDQPTLNRKALAAVVLALTPVFGIGSILAVVLGYKARREIAQAAGRQSGRDMAEVGIALGWAGVIMMAVVVPSLMMLSLALRARYGGG